MSWDTEGNWIPDTIDPSLGVNNPLGSGPSSMSSNFINPNSPLGIGIGAAAGGLIGAVPQTSSGTTTGSQSTQQSGTVNTQQVSDFINTLNSWMNLVGNTTGQTSQSGTGFTSGGYASPGAQALSDKLMSAFSQIATPVDKTALQAQNIQNINQASKAVSDAQQAALAARGLSSSPVAGAVAAQTQANRGAQITQMQEQLPLLIQQMNLQNLTAANQALANAPRTQFTSNQQTGTTAQQSSQTQTGTQTGEQSGVANTNQQSASQQNTNYNQTTKQKAGGGVGGALAGAAEGILSSIFGI